MGINTSAHQIRQNQTGTEKEEEFKAKQRIKKYKLKSVDLECSLHSL